jgi:medium-chain acyl-[acyl-carrier-protein] hydrolase
MATMSDPLVSSIDFDVRGYDCGYGGSLRTFALVNFLQEAAGINATKLGIGMDELHARGQTWMLSRLELRVDALPSDGERILVRTWPAGAKKLFAMRALDMRRPDGSLLVRAVYAYLVVDVEARRPLRPDHVFGGQMPCADEALPIADCSFDIPAAAERAISFAQRVRGRHIDYNGHANNAHIINWLADAAMPARQGPEDERRELSLLRVEFAAEALEGDELVATCGRASESFPGADCFSTELRRGDTKVASALVGLRRA